MNRQKRRALVTGATSGLGLALVTALLDEGYEVTATGRSLARAELLKRNGIDFRFADLTNTDELETLCHGQHVVFHAAALSRSWGPSKIFKAINYKATKNLLAVAKKTGCEHFIFVSSPSVYACMRDQFDLRETDLPKRRPLNTYARTKLLAEHAVQEANCKTFHTIILRPRAIVGPDDRVLLPKLISLLRRERVPLFRNGQALIELTDARDVAEALILADRKAKNLSGEIINISGGQTWTIREVAQALAQIIGQPIRFVPVPLFPARLMAIALETIGIVMSSKCEPVLTRYMLSTLAYAQTFDLTKARERLGFVPRYNAMETLLQVAQRNYV